jgi:DNA primase
LLEVGLIIERDDGGFYDRFRGRFMIPIRDPRGRVIGFGGRILGDGQPKYLNSPGSPLFNKSHVLFGLDLAKGAVRAKGEVVIVEGYMDVLQAHQAGFGNVVASMGTALTEHQLALLKRMTKRYILALDPDLAGDQGTLRGLTVARQTLDRQTVPVVTAKGWIRYESRLDADIRIMTLPENMDPDDLIRETPDQWETLVDASVPVVDYYLRLVTQDLDLSEARQKSEAVRRLAPVIAEIRDEVERTHYIQLLARMLRVGEQVVRRQVGSRRGSGGGRSSRTESQETVPSVGRTTFALEEHCLAVLLRRPERLAQIDELFDKLGLGALQEGDFASTENRALFAAWSTFETDQSWDEWVYALPASLQAHLEFLLSRGLDSEDLESKEAARDIERRALELRIKSVERTNQSLQILAVEALEQGDAKAVEYAQHVRDLTDDLRRLQQALSQRTALARRERERA